MRHTALGHTPDITGYYGPVDPNAQRQCVERVYALLADDVRELRRNAI